MSSETTESGFTFDYIGVIKLARDCGDNRHVPPGHLGVGLYGHEIFSFAKKLKKELMGDEEPKKRTEDVPMELIAALTRVGQLEAQVADLQAKLLATAITALTPAAALAVSA